MIKRILVISLSIVGFLFMLLIFNGLNISSNLWTKKLPVCPCVSPGKILHDGWAIDRGDISTFHKGASIGFRSYPSLETSEGQSGQQCCYDAKGELLTTGLGAGTPDRSGTCLGEHKNGVMIVDYKGVFYHFFKDVFPFFVMNIEKYQKYWTPDRGENCKTR
jgi:hypothetical protein